VDDAPAIGFRKRSRRAANLPARRSGRCAGKSVIAVARSEGDKGGVSRRRGTEQRNEASGRGKRNDRSLHGSPRVDAAEVRGETAIVTQGAEKGYARLDWLDEADGQAAAVASRARALPLDCCLVRRRRFGYWSAGKLVKMRDRSPGR
jgi:hypothetical protein